MNGVGKMAKYRCTVCNHVYDEKKGVELFDTALRRIV